MDEIFDHAVALALTQAENYRREFVDTTRLEARDHLRTILAAYALAADKPIPTPLLAALERAKRYMGD